jgi:hypothetical protein
MPVPMLMAKKLGGRLRQAFSSLSKRFNRCRRGPDPNVGADGGNEGFDMGLPCDWARVQVELE